MRVAVRIFALLLKDLGTYFQQIDSSSFLPLNSAYTAGPTNASRFATRSLAYLLPPILLSLSFVCSLVYFFTCWILFFPNFPPESLPPSPIVPLSFPSPSL